MLTSKQPSRRLDLPHEQGSWVEIRTLSGTQLQHAQAAARHEGVMRSRELGAEFVQATVAAAGVEAMAAARAENATDPLQGYHRRTLLLEGIVDWSYENAPVTPENIDDLDEETMQYVAEQIVPARRSEEERGNGFIGSTSPSTAVEPTRRKSG